MTRFSIGAVLAVLAACGSAQAQTAKGELIATEQCAGCHAVKPGQQSPNPKAPAFASLAADPSITELSLRAFLRTPHWTMPNIILKPDDIDEVAAYIVSLKPKP